jgi:hypothetical protein
LENLADEVSRVNKARGELADLQAELENASGKKATDALKEQIAELSQDIKGHLKEIAQKWPGVIP